MNSMSGRSGDRSDDYLDELASSSTTSFVFALGSLGVLLLWSSTWCGIGIESVPLGAATMVYLVLVPTVIVLYVVAIPDAIRLMVTRRQPHSYMMRSAMTLAATVSVYALAEWLLW